MPTLIDQNLLKQVVRELLESFVALPGLRKASVGDFRPVYDPQGELAYYEVKFSGENPRDRGYAILSATEDDLPVVEFSDRGPTHYERFQRVVREPFKMVRFGPTYVTAESADGRLMAEIGDKPAPIPANLRIQSRLEISDRHPRTREDIAAVKPPPRPRPLTAFDYARFKAAFRKKPIAPEYLRNQWEMAKSPNSPCLNNYYGVANRDILERGQTDEFGFRIADLGDLTSLRVRHDNSGRHPGWFLEDIVVRRAQPLKEWTFPCHRWLATDEDDGLTDRTLTLNAPVNYRISVRTGDRSNAGSDANVYVTLTGANGAGVERKIDNPGHDDFERGHTDVFNVMSADLGALSKLRVRHDNSGDHPGWFLEDVRVRNEATNQEWLFPCSRWLAKDEDDGHIERTLTLAAQTPYRISVRTGDRSNAGTDANVYITVKGTNGTDFERKLDNAGHDDFERGHTDTFNITTFDLGELTELRIHHDNSGDHPGWFLEDIRIRNQLTGREWSFPCSRWLAVDEEDHRTDRTLTLNAPVNYRISVRTGSVDRGGTDSKVFLTLYGKLETLPEFQLDNRGNDDFEAGHTDIFAIRSPDLGNIGQLRIRHDNSGNNPGWFLGDIRVRNDATGQEWVFPCSQWLATDEDDQAIDRTLWSGAQINYTIIVRTADRENAGTDANVFLTLSGANGDYGLRLVAQGSLDSAHRTFFNQIDPHTGRNTTDHSSGCGATAWLNLVGWHDCNWRDTILEGAWGGLTNDDTINKRTMQLHDYLGTFAWPTSDQGFTWPDDMRKGLEFIETNFRHSATKMIRTDWFNTDEDWVFGAARDVARNGRPFIVGYFEDMHYALGYEIAECTLHGWKAHSWIRIYPGWDTDMSGDKWIPKATIFAIYGVYDFTQL